MHARDWRESELRTFAERHVLSLCWTERLGYGINSHSMAALFDSDVICGNMAANRKYGMTSRWKKKFGTRTRRAGFSPFVLRRSTTEETVDKSNLGPLFPSSARSLQQHGNKQRNGKAGFNYFSQNKKKRHRGSTVGRQNWILTRQESPQISDANFKIRDRILYRSEKETITMWFSIKL